MRTLMKQFTVMRPKIDMDKIKHLPTAEDMFANEYGAKGTVARDEFDAKSRAWYYAEVLKNARKSAGITQQQLRTRSVRSVNMSQCWRKARQICSYRLSL